MKLSWVVRWKPWKKDPDEKTVFFPGKPKTIMAKSGIVSGSLVKAKRLKPSANGPLIYLNDIPLYKKLLTGLKRQVVNW